MKIGYLKSVKTGAHEELHGEIKTLQTQLKVRFVPEYMKKSDNAPDYLVFAGQDVEIGSAWTKRQTRPDGPDFQFLSITIDDPSFSGPLNVAAFKNNQDGWDVTWRRRQATQQTAA